MKFPNTTLHRIVLKNEKGMIVLDECKTEEEAKLMLRWYDKHKDFFNGTIEYNKKVCYFS